MSFKSISSIRAIRIIFIRCVLDRYFIMDNGYILNKQQI